MPEFQAWPKISRLFRECIVTEKLDGSNAAVGVTERGEVYAQSRKRLITPADDNAGFARWVAEHETELRDGLGIGLHFGEWWGRGIQRGYGLSEKRLSLFNTSRWGLGTPDCCSVVPVLAAGEFSTDLVQDVLAELGRSGSKAAPGFMRPEGVVVFHTHANVMFKATLENDQKGKYER